MVPGRGMVWLISRPVGVGAHAQLGDGHVSMTGKDRGCEAFSGLAEFKALFCSILRRLRGTAIE